MYILISTLVNKSIYCYIIIFIISDMKRSLNVPYSSHKVVRFTTRRSNVSIQRACVAIDKP